MTLLKVATVAALVMMVVGAGGIARADDATGESPVAEAAKAAGALLDGGIAAPAAGKEAPFSVTTRALINLGAGLGISLLVMIMIASILARGLHVRPLKAARIGVVVGLVLLYGWCGYLFVFGIVAGAMTMYMIIGAVVLGIAAIYLLVK